MTSPSTPIYSEGEAVELYCDLPHATITPTPPGVPGSGVRLRVVVTQRALTVGWMTPTGEVARVDLAMTAEQTADVTYVGGEVGGYTVGQAAGCSGCGASTLLRWLPFENIVLMQRMPPGQVYGVPPVRTEITQMTYTRP